MVKEGYCYGLPLALIAGGALALGLYLPAVLFLVLTLFILNFFRDPERTPPADPSAIISPADGRVVQIVEETFDGRTIRRISIFMSPVDVHVNRAPVSGTVRDVVYQKGRFGIASSDRASAENEQNIFTLESTAGPVVVRQIAGLLARRIVFWKRVGDRLERGERVGLIKFGSRVDVLLEVAVDLWVKSGDRVRAGSTVLAVAAGKDVTHAPGYEGRKPEDKAESRLTKKACDALGRHEGPFCTPC
jgi:phosphatidylserine decarboxylase